MGGFGQPSRCIGGRTPDMSQHDIPESRHAPNDNTRIGFGL